MLGQDTDALPSVGVPHAELAPVADAAARGDPLVVAAPSHTRDDPAMSLQPPQQPVAAGVPDIDVTIFARADQSCAAGVPGNLTDGTGLGAIRSELGASAYIPNPHALQQGSAGQSMSIGPPGQTEEESVIHAGVPQDLDTVAGGGIPQPDLLIQAAAGDPAAIGTPTHTIHAPEVATQHSRHSTRFRLPKRHLTIQASTDELRTIRTPGNVVEG